MDILSILNLIDPVSGSLLSAGIGALGSVFGSLFGKKSQDDTNKANMELAEYQYSKNLEMWNRQNEYNTPANQVKRIKAAGLNPALLYGSGSVANTASSAPSYQAPNLRAYTNFGDLGASYLSQIPLQAAQVRNLDSNSALTDQKTKTEIQETGLRMLQKQIAVLDKSIKEAQERNAWTDVKYYERLKKLTIRQMSATIGHTMAMRATELLKPDLLKAQTENYHASTDYTKSQRDTVEALRPGQLRNQAAEYGEIVSRTAKNYASALESRSHAALYSASIDLVRSQTTELTTNQQERLAQELAKLTWDVKNAKQNWTLGELKKYAEEVLKRSGFDIHDKGIYGLINRWGAGMVAIFYPDVYRDNRHHGASGGW